MALEWQCATSHQWAQCYKQREALLPSLPRGKLGDKHIAGSECVSKCSNLFKDTQLYPKGEALRPWLQKTPQGLFSCPTAQMSTLPMNISTLNSHVSHWNTFLSKAAALLLILSTCSPTEVALDKSYWAEETRPKAHPPQQHKATTWLSLNMSTCKSCKTDLDSAPEIHVCVGQLQTGL